MLIMSLLRFAGLNNPFAVMSYLTPVMTALSLILSLILEPWSKFGESHYFDTPRHVMSSCALMLLGGALAFCMVSTRRIFTDCTLLAEIQHDVSSMC